MACLDLAEHPLFLDNSQGVSGQISFAALLLPMLAQLQGPQLLPRRDPALLD